MHGLIVQATIVVVEQVEVRYVEGGDDYENDGQQKGKGRALTRECSKVGYQY